MRTSNLLYALSLILLISCPSAYSQFETQKIFFTNDISIDYSDDSLIAASSEKGKDIKIKGIQNLEDINTVKIISDSIINVSGDNIANANLNINKIKSISVRNGSYSGLGIGVGALTGLGAGILIIATSNYEKSSDPATNVVLLPVNMGVNLLWGVLSTITGAIVGGIIGGNITSYDKYQMNDLKYNKKQELERILRIDGKLNNENK